MARAAPTLPTDRIAEAARVISGQGKGKAKARSSPKFTSSGPSHKQVLVSFDKERGVLSMNLAMVSATVSAALCNGGKRLRVQSTSPAYDSWSHSTSAIATTAEIDIICDRIREVLPQDRRGNDSFWVGAPALTLYLRILDIQYFKQPPWRLIRCALSARDPLGEMVIGMPNHSNWTVMVRHQTDEG
ncbi:hypothetical protein L218DRAFT_1001975 [Marasmius fiardii PR-910]|nr:hypothetical protein L218DRAFT_1001975 [Marasmius fiardii PR-910]